MYKASIHLVVTYFLTYPPIYETYFSYIIGYQGETIY
jgi:hypothetical protein